MLGKWPTRIVEAIALLPIAAIEREHNAKSAPRKARPRASTWRGLVAGIWDLAPGMSEANAVRSNIGVLCRPNKPDFGKSEEVRRGRPALEQYAPK